MKEGFLTIAIAFVCCFNSADAQKHDYIWLSGYDSHVGYDPHWGVYFGTSIMDFNHIPRTVSYDSLAMNFDFTNASFCDSDGHLLFYSNGIYVANSLDEKIENSDSLNAGHVPYVMYPMAQTYGYRNHQGILAIPSIQNQNQYYIIHSWEDSFNTGIICKRVLSTLVDMSDNIGHGKVLFKNHTVVDNYLGSELVATKHANGRDWWILVQKRNTNCYYRILVDSAGVHALADLTCGGSAPPYDDDGTACFSPDGSKYIYLGYNAGLNIFDFDRCTGDLSNPIYLPLPTLAALGWQRLGVSVSPNNRFLYVGVSFQMYQFDLWATNVLSSIDTVGIYDGTNAPFGTYFHTEQNGPDGKIYLSYGNADTVYSVIEQPDEKGDSCLFRQHSLSLPSPSAGVPNFPNYRLGALPGSACDTLSGLSETTRAEREKILKVYPNPATDFVVVDYGFTDWNKGEIYLEVTNELWQLTCHQHLPMYSGFQKIDISNFAAGFYTAYIKRNNQIVATAKFAKQ